jgi:adenosylhomocysteine nucleosidase
VIGVIFATPKEATPFLAGCTAVEEIPARFPLFRIAGAKSATLLLALSGMGKVAAAIAAVSLVCEHGVSRLFNAGICGALEGERAGGHRVGTLFGIATAREGDLILSARPADPVSLDRGPFSELPEAHLVTCDTPVFDPERRQILAPLGDLVDMEGAAVARVAQIYGVPCSLLKGISDFADSGDRQRLEENLTLVSAKIADTLLRVLIAYA